MFKELRDLLNEKNKTNSNLLLGVAIFAPIIVLMFIKFFIALFQIPLEFDSLVYHLPIVTEWLQTGSIMNIYYNAFAGPLAYYPSNFDLFYLWSMLPINNDFFINLINFPLFLLLTLTIYCISINFGISKKVSLFISAFPLYMPVFLQQAGTIFVDIYFILTFSLSIYFLQEVAKNTVEKSNSIMFGLALGLFMGTKYLGLPYGIIPLAIFILIHLFRKNKSYYALASGLFSVFLTGSFFYIRNWINSGNPIFPVEINLFGHTLFQGYPNISDKIYGSSLLSNISEISVIKEFASAFWTMTDLPGFLVLISVIISFIFISISLVKKRISKPDLIIATLLLVGSIGYLLFYIKSPYSYSDLIYNVRYAMPFLILGSLNIGFLVTKIKRLRVAFYIFSTFAFIHSLYYLFIIP
ncbi:MAG: hypothetical protein HQ490_08455, partial [Lutibacter sp.]|nr:hypothetical protein [Lutibacter sp.]